MSSKEKAKGIIDRLPEYKVEKILYFLQGMEMSDEIDDDMICEKIYQDYLNDPDPEKDTGYTLEDCKTEWGLA